MLNLINDLQILIENEQTNKDGIENEMSANAQERDTTNLFEDLMIKHMNYTLVVVQNFRL